MTVLTRKEYYFERASNLWPRQFQIEEQFKLDKDYKCKCVGDMHRGWDVGESLSKVGGGLQICLEAVCCRLDLLFITVPRI